MTVGEKIRNLRKKRKMSQEQVAKHLGYSNKTSISKIEKGQSGISAQKVVELAELFQVTPNEILCETTKEESNN